MNSSTTLKSVPVDSIQTISRIRQDLGDIEGLAESIRALGLLSPIIINEENKLLAGERRLAAVRSLGYSHVDAIILTTADAEREFAIEYSENKFRKDFTREEEVDAGMRLERIESIKANERVAINQFGSTAVENFPPPQDQGKTRDIVASHFGISGKQYERNKFIVQHKDLLSPGEYADWNNRTGSVSTNKLYTAIKAIINPPKPKQPHEVVVDRIVEVKPKDYDDLVSRVAELEETNKRLNEKVASASASASKVNESVPSINKEETDDLKRKYDDLAAQLSTAQQQYSELASQYSAAQQTIEDIRTENNRLQQSMPKATYKPYSTNKILDALAKLDSVVQLNILPLMYDEDFANVSGVLLEKIDSSLNKNIKALEDCVLALHSGNTSNIVDVGSYVINDNVITQ